MRGLLISCLALTMALFVVAGGCKKNQATDSGKKKIIIGIVAKSSSNAVFQAAHAGAKDAGKELGPKYGVEVEVDIRTPVDESPARQTEAIDALVRAGVHGIAVACSEANTLTPAINRAVDAGVVVVCFDSDAPKSKRLCYYGTDDITCGKMVMSELAKTLGDKGTIAILAGNQAAPNLQARVAGVREELKNHPQIKEIAAGPAFHEETPEKAAQKVDDLQRSNPDITGWAMVGGWPLFTRNALKWPAGSIKVVSVDALPPQLPYLKEGYVEVLLAQDCYGWGGKSVEILLDKIVNKKDPAGPRIIDPLTRVTKENADEYGKKWEKWLGK